MRIIAAKKITEVVSGLCEKANFELRPDVLVSLRRALRSEKNKRARSMLEAIIKNAQVARREKLAVCQDTGLPVVFLQIGQETMIKGDLKKAVNAGIAQGYKKGFLRNSIVADPLSRKTPGYVPAVMHTEIVPGKKITVTVLPKGFGCENKSQLKMFVPTASWDEIKEFIIEAVKNAGPDACPPYVVGVGIGGTADTACLLAKKALLKKVTSHRSPVTSRLKGLEVELLKEINRLGIGPMGLGGRTTALAVNILTFPTHIAGLPVSVNISCHATRSAAAVI